MPHKQSLRRKENLRGLCTFFKEISSSLVIKKSEKRLQHQFWANLQKYLRDAFLSIQKHIHCSKEAFSLLHYKKQRVILQIDIKLKGMDILTVFKEFLRTLGWFSTNLFLGLPPSMVNIVSELFSSGLTPQMLILEMIKVCIHLIITRLYYPL